jgi:kinetochore protein NDC80
MTAETSGSNAEMEKLERELQQMRITAQNGILQLEQRSQSVGIEYDQLVHASHAIKEDVYREVVRILEEVIKFKLNVQTGLESLQDELDGVMTDAIEESVL